MFVYKVHFLFLQLLWAQCDVSEHIVFTAGVCKFHVKSPSGMTTPDRLSTTAYSIYSQLTSIYVGLLPHPQPDRTRHAVVTGTQDI
jgi:hypothetical protein